MASRDSMDVTADLIGRLVDNRYKVLEPMASGSMGAVYKAERVPVGKQVAIKFLHAAFANDAEFITRFERETRVMSKLAHPNCVSVVDFGVFEGSPYLVMDFVAGKTLRSLLDDAPIDPTRALALMRQVASGLAHAHAQGIVHRDIKPANIMITDEIGTGEHARILDFGLARLRGAVGNDATQINVVVGTPNYMAPEQTIGGGTIDARTDIYAVGVVLFEMISGVRPFQAEDTLALLGMHRAAPIPKLADRLDRTIILPNGVQKLIEKAMAKSPADRYQSAIELADGIDEITGARTTTEPKGKVVHRTKTPMAGIDTAIASTLYDVTSESKTKPPKKSSSFGGTMLAILLLAAGAGGAWYVFGRGSKQDGPKDAAQQVAKVDAPSASSIDDAAVRLHHEDRPIDAAVTEGSGSGSGSGSASVVESGSGSAVTVGSGSAVGSGSGSAAGSGSGGNIEMEPDPSTAEHVAPKAPETEDEAEDAPKKDDEVEKRAPPAPGLAKTFPEVLALIKEGKSELAITSLRNLWKFNPKNAHIPWLLANLYFDKGWWSISLDHYQKAIKQNPKYGVNQILNRNIIRMLVSPKTRGAADYTLRKMIGKQALPYLRQAAASDRNAYVRNHAAALVKAIGGR